MSDFLDRLKAGMQEAQQKYGVAQQKFTAAQAESQLCQQRLAAAQAEYQAATLEYQAFQTLVNSQTRKEQPAAGTPPEGVRVAPANPPLTASNTVNQDAVVSQPTNDDNKSEGSKTQAVRDLLRLHPSGMTPGEIWSQLERKMSNRAYLYSVLKRLRDKGDARQKRGKYFLNFKPDQGQTLVQ